MQKNGRIKATKLVSFLRYTTGNRYDIPESPPTVDSDCTGILVYRSQQTSVEAPATTTMDTDKETKIMQGNGT